MRKPTYGYDDQDADELLRQVDAALDDESDWDRPDETVVFQNYSNRYGRDVRNYQNNYGQGYAPERPAPTPAQETPFYAYNADFASNTKKKRTVSSVGTTGTKTTAQSRAEAVANGKKSPKKHPLRPLVVVLLILVLLIAAVWFLLIRAPRSDQSLAGRKADTASILLCGTDGDGTRTDTMMLLYISGSERQVNLISLPRDTYTVTAAGYGAKLNSAYGRNGTGEEGMEGLLDYVQDIIGYRPDGYVLVDFSMIIDVVDVMGGVDFDVPVDFSWWDPDLDRHFDVSQGLQTLDGNDVLGVLRFRHGYYNQDLGRIEVQRDVIKACMEQWISLSNVTKGGSILKLFQDRSISNLSAGNYLWAATRVMAIGTGDLTTETLPGYATMIGDQSYYVLYPEQVAELINRAANPYHRDITVDDLHIVG